MAKQEQDRQSVPANDAAAVASAAAPRRFRVSANTPTPLQMREAEVEADGQSQAIAAFKRLNGLPADGSIGAVVEVVEL